MFESWQAPPIPTDAAIEPRPVPDPAEPPPLSLVPATLSLVRRQAELILKRARAEGGTEVRFNSEWLEPMSFADVIRLGARYMT